ncbi:hypothetical protein NP493_129g04033 [Ridgeia piscesae]|uniref:ABCA1-4-like C-terminal R2 regulatory domain-containing protein n=1 Tax=Ridgeia piscesae TaxID=27915 RepID=A0AAD9P5S7_RIDPI|nr:hypothetical protein NP493_129g04033 [Ridgeia piscesae]
MVGDPLITLLDEPTSGVDPGARRQAWIIFAQFRENGRTNVLSSHSMDECEALCHRLVIMVNGRFQCLGSLQHLKSKVGHDYMLTVQLRRTHNGDVIDSVLLNQLINDRFPGCVLKSSCNGQLRFSVPKTGVTWAMMFSALHEVVIASEYHVEDYSTRQTTLEKIFIDLAHDI